MQPQINHIITKNLQEIKERINKLEVDKEKFTYENHKCVEAIFVISDEGKSQIECLVECGKEDSEFEKYLKVKLESFYMNHNIGIVTQ